MGCKLQFIHYPKGRDSGFLAKLCIKLDIPIRCFEVSKHVLSSEGEPLASKTTRTLEDLVFNLGFFGKKRKCYMSEIFHIRKAEIRLLVYYKEKKYYDCNY